MSKMRGIALVVILFFFPCLASAQDAEAAQEQAILNQEKAQEKITKREETGEVAEEYRQKLKETIAPTEEAYTYELDSFVRYMPTVNARHQSGKVQVTDSASEYNYLFKLFGKIPTQAGFAAEQISINNSTQLQLPTQLTTVAFGMESTVPFFNFDKTYFRFGFAPSFYSDGWDIRGSDFRIPMKFFLINTPNDKLALIGGIAIRPDCRDDYRPILGFIYRPNDRLTFNIVPESPSISYKMSDKWTVFWEGDGSSGEYKVNIADHKGQVMEYNEYHTGLGTSYMINKYIELSVSGGYMFDRTIRYRSKDEGKVVLEGGAYTEFRVEITI